MGNLVVLGIYAALAIAALGAIHAFDLSRQRIGADRQLAADKPVLAACVADRDAAVKGNASLQIDLQRLGDERDAQTRAVEELRTLADAKDEEKKRLQQASASALAALRADRLATLERITSATRGETCEDTLGKIDVDLRDLAVRELRDRPPAAGGQRGADAPAHQDSGAGTVRLTR